MSVLTFAAQPARRTQRYSVAFDGKIITIAFLGYSRLAPVQEQSRAARAAAA